MHRAAVGVFFQGRGSGEQENISAKDAQHAIKLMREFDGFSGIAARAGQGGQGDRLRPQSDGVIGGHNPLIVQAEATGEIEAAGRRRKSQEASAAGCAKR